MLGTKNNTKLSCGVICSIIGLPGHPIENVLISDVSIHHDGGVEKAPANVADDKEKEYPEATMFGTLPAKGFFVRHARNVVIEKLNIKTDKEDCRPVLVEQDVE